jgi:hypothetical protein
MFGPWKNKNRQASLRWRFVGEKFRVSLAGPLRRQAGEKVGERIKPVAHGEGFKHEGMGFGKSPFADADAGWHSPQQIANPQGHRAGTDRRYVV